MARIGWLIAELPRKVPPEPSYAAAGLILYQYGCAGGYKCWGVVNVVPGQLVLLVSLHHGDEPFFLGEYSPRLRYDS